MFSATPYAHQVAGHASSILSPPSWSSVILKPSTHSEHDFYTRLSPSLLLPSGDNFTRVWAPEFMGTMNISDGKGEGGEGGGEMLVLENLTYRFSKPNVLDIKLGTQLYDPLFAPPAKQARLTKVASETTSAHFGFRLSGFKIWDPVKSSYHHVPSTFGKSLPPQCAPSLSKALRAFFLREALGVGSALEANREGEIAILKAVAERLGELERDLVDVRIRIRIRGGSLLVVCEGDDEARRESIERLGGKKEAQQGEDQEEQKEEEEDEEEDSDSILTSNSEGEALPHTFVPFEVRLIDFAHVSTVEWEEGPDEGVLKGVRNLRMLLEGILEELQDKAGVY